jgi:hypothetical protein
MSKTGLIIRPEIFLKKKKTDEAKGATHDSDFEHTMKHTRTKHKLKFSETRADPISNYRVNSGKMRGSYHIIVELEPDLKVQEKIWGTFNIAI